MRGVLVFVSAGLMVLGLELATEAVSLTLARLQAGFAALGAGVEFHVSAGRFGLGISAMIVGAVLLVLLWWSARQRVAAGSVGQGCPQCGGTTRRIKRHGLHRLLSLLLGERLTRRKCDTCGWLGLSLRH